MNNDNCSYCNKPLGNSYKFSYGFPEIPQTSSCERLWCRIIRRIKRKRNKILQNFIKRLNEIIKRLNEIINEERL